LDKIVVNAGVGRASQMANFEEKVLPQIVRDISFICGQKPKLARAKKSIAGFKTREGQIVGLQATLRGRAAVDFFERLTTIVLPRVRDFNGIDAKNVDRHGALNIGFKEQLVFPELDPEESTLSFSLGVNIVPKARNREEAVGAYRALGVAFKK
jgi:large subunit ribosomal protein L5